jgi:general secretion pathway protein A
MGLYSTGNIPDFAPLSLKNEKVGRKTTNFLTFLHFSVNVDHNMQDEQQSLLHSDQQLFQLASSVDPKVLTHFRLLEHPYRGGPDFRYLYTTDQIQEVIIQSVQLTISRTAPFTLTGPYGTGKSTIITRTYSLLSSREEFDVKLIYLHRGVTKNWLVRKIAEAFDVKTARAYSQTLENVQNYFASVDQTKVVPTLILDDGHFMDDECLSALYSLLNVEDNKVKYVQLIVAGQEPLLDKIARMGELDSRMRSIEIAPMTPEELKKMFQFRWKVAGGQEEDFPFAESDMESFNIIFRYSKGLPRDAIKVGDELLKLLAGREAKKVNPADVEEVAQKTLKKGKYKMQDTENKV